MQEKLYKFENNNSNATKCSVKIHLANRGQLSSIPAILQQTANTEEYYLLINRIIDKVHNKPLSTNTELLITLKEDFIQCHASIDEFTAFNNNYDEYKLKHLIFINKADKRQAKRQIIQIPISLKPFYTKDFISLFTGCDLSTTGMGLWLPLEYNNYILSNNIYEITLHLDSYTLILQARCIGNYQRDIFLQGFKAGFEFIELTEYKQHLLRDIINKKRVFSISSSINILDRHHLADYWQSFISLLL